MKQSDIRVLRIHAADCRCSKCPNSHAISAQRYRRLLVAMVLNLIGIVAGIALLLQGGSAL